MLSILQLPLSFSKQLTWHEPVHDIHLLTRHWEDTRKISSQVSHGISHIQLILVQFGWDHLRKFNLDSCADKSKIKRRAKTPQEMLPWNLACVKSTEAMIWQKHVVSWIYSYSKSEWICGSDRMQPTVVHCMLNTHILLKLQMWSSSVNVETLVFFITS